GPLLAAEATRAFVTVADGRDVTIWDLASDARPIQVQMEERILAIASGRLGEQPVVVTTSEAGRIRAFDCRSGAPAGRSISVAPRVATGVDTVTVDGRLLVPLRCSHPAPSGDSKNWFIDPISTYDLATGKRALARQQRDLRPRHMHCRVINGEPLAAVSD